VDDRSRRDPGRMVSSPPREEPGDLFFRTDPRPVPRPKALRSWLMAVSEDRADFIINLFTSGHLVLIDEEDGREIKHGDDILLVWSAESSEIFCFGPSWARFHLPPAFYRSGLDLWLDQLNQSTVVALPTRRRSVASVAIQFAPQSALEETAYPTARETTAAIRKDLALFGNDLPDTLAAVLERVTAEQIIAGSPTPRDLKRAKWHLENSISRYYSSNLLDQAAYSHRLLAAVSATLNEPNQLELPLSTTLGGENRPDGMGFLAPRMTRLSAIPLPACGLEGFSPGTSESQPGRLELLTRLRTEPEKIRAFLNPYGTSSRPKADVTAMSPGTNPPQTQRHAPLKVKVGQMARFSAIVDWPLNVFFRVPSRTREFSAGLILQSTGLETVEFDTTLEKGFPVDIQARATTPGLHPVSFTFLTAKGTLSKVVRQILVNG
jgi:hypothetical protein